MFNQTEQQFQTLSASALAMVQARNETDLQIIRELHCCGEQIGSAKDDAGIPIEAGTREAYLGLKEALFSLLYEMLCSNELLWYENHQPALDQDSAAYDLCKPLRHFLNMTDELAGSYLHLGECDIPHFLYSQVLPDRLIFVLLHQLMHTWSENLTLNVLDLFAAKDKAKGEICLVLTLRRDDTVDTLVLPEPKESVLHGADALDSAAALTDRFCALYGVHMMQQTTQGKHVCKLSLPASGVLENRIQVASDSALLMENTYTLYHAVFTRLLPIEAVLWASAYND